jgi:uncharacterized membrane protein YqaE (UPF0057 family)
MFYVHYETRRVPMGIIRAIFCVLLPPLAVIDKGLGNILIVIVLTLLGWVPGIIGALIICLKKDK